MKRKTLKRTLAFLVLLSFASCGREPAPAGTWAADTSDADKYTYLRIANQSGFDFKNVTIDSLQYGDIKRGGRSQYQKMEGRIYRYAGVQLKAGKNDLALQPIDYVGESLFGPGKFTYVLNVVTNSEINVVSKNEKTPPKSTPVKGKGHVFPSDDAVKLRVKNSSGVLLHLRLSFEPVSIKPGETTDYYDQGGPWLPGEVEVLFDQPVPRYGGEWEKHHMKWHTYENKALGEWNIYTITIITNLGLDLSFEQDK